MAGVTLVEDPLPDFLGDAVIFSLMPSRNWMVRRSSLWKRSSSILRRDFLTALLTRPMRAFDGRFRLCALPLSLSRGTLSPPGISVSAVWRRDSPAAPFWQIWRGA